MSTNERPGVYSSIEVSGSINGARGGKVVGLAGISDTGEKGVVTRVLSVAGAIERFGADCALTELIRILFLNGAFAVEAVPVSVGAVPAETSDYEAAFAALMEKESVSLMICDSTDTAVQGVMRATLLSASENNKYRIGVVEAAGTVAEVCPAAKAFNCERIAMVYAAGERGACIGENAAAVAGIIASGTDPALPLNGAELFGSAGVSRCFSDAEITALIDAGLTPVERVGEAIYVVRGLTTKTTTGGEPDSTWRELTTVLIVDDVVPAVRSALRVKFPRVKNTLQTRGAIRTQVIIELENKLKREIIESYGGVTAEASQEDPTVCLVSFSFSVAHGLNRINLTAHISV